MSAFYKNFLSLQTLEESALQKGVLQQFHPALKIVLSLIYTLCVVSCQSQQIGLLLPFALILCVLHVMARIPLGLFWKRLVIALPFGLFAGIWGCFMNTTPITIVGIHTTVGILSLMSILFRTCLCVGGLLILVGVTPIRDLSSGMRQMHIPVEFVILFELICRYLGVIIDEAVSLHRSYQLRGGSSKGIALKYFGSLAGGLLMRSYDRASKIYQAMVCRGFPELNPSNTRPPWLYEWLFALSFTGLCLFLRFAF